MDEFIALTNTLADQKAKCTELEYAFEKAKAHYIKTAMDSKAKTRAIDYVKVIGNTAKDEEYLDGMKRQIIELNRQITISYGKIEAWKSNKDLYRTDSYHQITGRAGSLIDKESDE